MYVGLLAYSQVFSNSITAAIGCDDCSVATSTDAAASSSSRCESFCQYASRPFLSLLFAAIVVPLSCCNLDEQITIQGMMAVARFLAIFVMVGGSVYALLNDPENSQLSNNETLSGPPYFAPPSSSLETSEMSYTFSFSGFGVMFSTALFSQLFQHSVPGLIRPLPKAQKKHVASVFFRALLTTAALYLFLGITSACYFGATTSSSVNLNFTDFSYGVDLASAPRWKRYLVSSLSYIVVLFPAADTLSVFPLIANTLGNNLSTSTPHLREKILIFFEAQGYFKKKSRKRISMRLSMILWRLVASLPPIFFSVFMSDLAFSLQLAGLAGLYVAFICPALLQRESYLAIKRNFPTDDNIYIGWQTSRVMEILVLTFSAFSFVVVSAQMWNKLQAII